MNKAADAFSRNDLILFSSLQHAVSQGIQSSLLPLMALHECFLVSPHIMRGRELWPYCIQDVFDLARKISKKKYCIVVS